MDDNAKIVNQNTPPLVQPVVPSSPSGSMNKEVNPAKSSVSEFMKPAGPEITPNLPQEVSESGVEAKSDKPDLTFEHQALGMEHAGPNVPVSSTPSNIVMPMSEEEVADKLKVGQDDDSGKGLAKLLQKIIKAIGF